MLIGTLAFSIRPDGSFEADSDSPLFATAHSTGPGRLLFVFGLEDSIDIATASFAISLSAELPANVTVSGSFAVNGWGEIRVDVDGVAAWPPVPIEGSIDCELSFGADGAAFLFSEPPLFNWRVALRVAGADLSERLVGEVRISASEYAARVCTLDMIPASSVELAGLPGASVELDIVLMRGATMSTFRRFTGMVESVDYAAGARIATLNCRDRYQDTIKACADAASVDALFDGLATPMPKIVEWDADKPDPAGYFKALASTARGACAIDSAGTWRAVPWNIESPSCHFYDSHVMDDSVTVRRADKSSTPSAVVAKLVFRFHRLHAVEKRLTWVAPERARYVVDGLPVLTKTTVQAALEGAQGWLIKGAPTMVSPLPGVYPVIVGGHTAYYIVDHAAAPMICQSLDTTMYRRWYQQVEVTYTVTVPMGGASDSLDAVSASLESSFDAGSWETAPSGEASLGIYQSNAPTVAVEPTGYEGLPYPPPPVNSSLDWHPDISPADLAGAVDYVVACATRAAAEARRKQTVSFDRPCDPRWEIGAVLGLATYDLAAEGQVVSFEERLDHDSGLAITTYELACPDGDGSVTAYAASSPPEIDPAVHALLMPPLDTHVGASYDTPARPDEASLLGFLCNVLPTSDNFDATKPVFEPQFRVIMPEIPAEVRDPLLVDADISATVNIAGGVLEIDF